MIVEYWELSMMQADIFLFQLYNYFATNILCNATVSCIFNTVRISEFCADERK